MPALFPAAAVTSTPPDHWKVRVEVTPADEKIAELCDISPVTAAILRHRGHDNAAAVINFLRPDASVLLDPMLLPDIEVAIERLYAAINSGESVLIFGDYDVDGVTSTALLVRALRPLGKTATGAPANIHYRLPERHEGYGLSAAAVDDAHRHGHTLIVTADCGITAHEAADRAKELGIDLIITDHHEIGAALPNALAVVNPKRADSRYSHTELSGCGLVYKVVQALLGRHWPKHAPSFQEKFVDFVALAAIADCVSLTGENRYLCFEGLKRVASTQKIGLQALMRVAELKWEGDSLSGHHVAFRLAPRLNAAGRLASPLLALELLLANDAERAGELAGQLEELNRERQSQTRGATAQAIDQVEGSADFESDCLLIAADPDWGQGVVGLIASKLVERFHRPAFALRLHDGLARGSGRSVPGFDLHELLESPAIAPLLLSGGGHAAACGLTLREADLEEFRAAALAFAASRLDPNELGPRVEADCGVEGGHISIQLAADLAKLEPCGVGNEAVTLMLRGAVLKDARVIGSTGEHSKLTLHHNHAVLEALWWRSADRLAEFPRGSAVDVVFVPELNSYNGRTRVQLVIKHARLS